MRNRRGEIATILTIGTLIVIGVTAVISSLGLKDKRTTSSRAAGTCSTVQCSTLGIYTGTVCFSSPNFYTGACSGSKCSGSVSSWKNVCKPAGSGGGGGTACTYSSLKECSYDHASGCTISGCPNNTAKYVTTGGGGTCAKENDSCSLKSCCKDQSLTCTSEDGRHTCTKALSSPPCTSSLLAGNNCNKNCTETGSLKYICSGSASTTSCNSSTYTSGCSSECKLSSTNSSVKYLCTSTPAPVDTCTSGQKFVGTLGYNVETPEDICITNNGKYVGSNQQGQENDTAGKSQRWACCSVSNSSPNASCPKPGLGYACCVVDSRCANDTNRYRWYGCTGQVCSATIISTKGGPGHLVDCPYGVNKQNQESCEGALTPPKMPSADCKDYYYSGLLGGCLENCKGTGYECKSAEGDASGEQRFCCPPPPPPPETPPSVESPQGNPVEPIELNILTPYDNACKQALNDNSAYCPATKNSPLLNNYEATTVPCGLLKVKYCAKIIAGAQYYNPLTPYDNACKQALNDNSAYCPATKNSPLLNNYEATTVPCGSLKVKYCAKKKEGALTNSEVDTSVDGKGPGESTNSEIDTGGGSKGEGALTNSEIVTGGGGSGINTAQAFCPNPKIPNFPLGVFTVGLYNEKGAGYSTDLASTINGTINTSVRAALKIAKTSNDLRNSIVNAITEGFLNGASAVLTNIAASIDTAGLNYIKIKISGFGLNIPFLINIKGDINTLAFKAKLGGAVGGAINTVANVFAGNVVNSICGE